MRTAEDGFTVLELLLSVAILTVIVGTLSMAMIVFLENGREAMERDDHSGGALTLSSYLDRDVASANDAAEDGTLVDCENSTDVVLLSMSWRQYSASSISPVPTPSGPTFASAYVVNEDPNSNPPDGSPRLRLQRISCLDSNEADRVTLIPNLEPSVAITPTITPNACSDERSELVFAVPAYNEDTGKPFHFSACVATRIS